MLVLSDVESSAMIASSEASAVPIASQGPSPHCMTPGVYTEYTPSSPSHHAQDKHHAAVSGGAHAPVSPLTSHSSRQWDINDTTLPTPDAHDPFDLWPSGHYRRVYRGDGDDARRHVSGWAMRNTNNHNALILKKSCLGVLVCSLDCLLDSGKKVHLRPAICDKARRKQIGKPCPNVGCSGKLTLLSCRGHCGYPVTHFWRHVNNAVYFQSKGYHDHPRPEVKSLTDKGRQVYTKQMSQDRNRLLSALGKRRFPMLTSDTFEKKMVLSEKEEVMCSCPPFECVCSNSISHRNFLPSSAFGHIKDTSGYPNRFFAHQPPASHMPKKEHLSHLPITQINITNTCLPAPTLDAHIPNIEIYQNYSSYNPDNYYHDSDLKLFKYSSDSGHYPLPHEQHFLRFPFNNLRSPQVHNVSNIMESQHADYPSRHFNSSGGTKACCSSCVSDCKGNCNRRRVSQCVMKGRSQRGNLSEGCPMSGLVFKAEPGEIPLANIESSLREEGNPDFPAEPIYSPLSSAFCEDHLLSPKSTETHFKTEHSPDPVVKEQERPEEPTYITLTSPQGQSQGNQMYREFHSCRLVHSNRSPVSCLDASRYPAPPTQPTQIDVNNPPFDPTIELIPRHGNHKEDYVSPLPSPRSSPAMPHLLFQDNSTNIHSSCGRNNAFHLPVGAYHEPNLGPILLAKESHVMPYSPNSTAVYGGTSNAPYGFYCDDKFNAQTPQNYRNRSINITLTYN